MGRCTVVRATLATVLTCLVLCTIGCGPGRPARLVPPPLDPAAVAAAAIAAADVDGNGSVGGDEIRKVPALAAALKHLDTDGDQSLSVAELRTWLEAVRESRVAITSFTAAVTHKGKPLAGATVRLVPEPFMGRDMQPAEAVTDASGTAFPTIRDSKYPGVNCGLYRVEIEATGVDGKPLPARYNTDSTLGVAVGGLLPENGMATFPLE